ncbi:MAG: hypothetical protein IKP47_06695 [Ruminococcus sp.]|nr:hypothetical protein [Ruminococcus sp.]
MNIEFRKAELSDAEMLTDIYDSSFCDDHIRYGGCPAYGKTAEMMRQSIVEYPTGKTDPFANNIRGGVRL